MRELPRSERLVLDLLLWACVLFLGAAGCTTQLQIEGDADSDFGDARTWAWAPGGVQVEPEGATPRLRERIRVAVEESLEKSGFRRVAAAETPADFLVAALASLERRERWVRVGMAPYRFDSYHASPSYIIEGSVLEQRVFETLRIGLSLRRAGSGADWRGVAGDVVDVADGLPAERLVRALIDRLPEVSQLPDDPQRPGAPERGLEVERLAHRPLAADPLD